ncbi:hypothetical protein [Nocardia sp. NPDC048505]|uniref:hypothetical protein n=1 Tax=unclassified Nocardia TaxID=2637762 RepID=UPI0033C89A96
MRRLKTCEEADATFERRLTEVIFRDTETVTHIYEEFDKVHFAVGGVKASIGGDLEGTLEGRSIVTRLDSMDLDIRTLKSDVETLKFDVSELKTDVSGLKKDVSGLKKDVGTLKSDMKLLTEGMGEVLRILQKSGSAN